MSCTRSVRTTDQDELEVPIPEALRSCYERLSDNVRVVTDDIRQIQANIAGKMRS